MIALPSGPITFDIAETRGRHRTHAGLNASTGAERKAVFRAAEQKARMENIVILDTETDPFDADTNQDIKPFVACLYSDKFDPIVIWEENFEAFCDALLQAILDLEEPSVIYAHNGGKFDYMFLIHRLRGKISFKGRGIMSAKIGPHELRDSFHIIPERLAAFQKDAFDYNKMKKDKRQSHRDEIVRYLINDCRYLNDIVKGFVGEFGLKISIGQAAMAELKKIYKPQNIGENLDTGLREYFFGGRVECLAGRGHFKGKYKLYDVNSMYPYVMAKYKHPISNDYTKRTKGGIGPSTVFIDLTCDNYGALVKRSDNNETTANVEHGRFLTTIYEYNTAVELGLIDNVRIHSVIDNANLSDFSLFVEPRYEERQLIKGQLKALTDPDAQEYIELKRQDIFIKLILNNAYGKFAQNPRRFKESHITGPDDGPPEGYEEQVLPAFRSDEYAIWQRPSPNRRFNNVGTAASITGAARSILMRAIHNAVDPIYCDTDSLICKSLPNTVLHPTELGAWDLESEFDEVIIAGKKLYSCKVSGIADGQKGRVKIRSKGVSGLEWSDMEKLLDDQIIEVVNKAPTLLKSGAQFYMRRKVRATTQTTNGKHNDRQTRIAHV